MEVNFLKNGIELEDGPVKNNWGNRTNYVFICKRSRLEVVVTEDCLTYYQKLFFRDSVTVFIQDLFKVIFNSPDLTVIPTS